jgi:hypothetical protein
MTTQQAAIVIASALEFLAQKHSVTIEQILTAYSAGDQKVVEQVNRLVSLGLDKVDELNKVAA